MHVSERCALTIFPRLGTEDGAISFWNAMIKVFSDTQQQCCWVHKIADVLASIHKDMQHRKLR